MQVRTRCQNKPLSTSGPSSSLSSAASECCFSPYRIFSLRTQQLMPEGLTFPAPARELSFRLPLPLRGHSASCQRPPKSLETPSFSDSGIKWFPHVVLSGAPGKSSCATACREALGVQKTLAVGMRLRGRGTLAWRGVVVREETRIAEGIWLVARERGPLRNRSANFQV